jgi:hypothetical protein
VKGNGTFIKGCEPGSASKTIASRNVLAIMKTSGDVFSTFFDSLTRHLSKRGCATITTGLDFSSDDFHENSHITSLLNSGIRGVIAYGDAYWKNPVMLNHPACQRFSSDTSIIKEHRSTEKECFLITRRGRTLRLDI